MFDYYLCHESKKWMPWTDKVPNFELDPEVPLQVLFVTLAFVPEFYDHLSLNLYLRPSLSPNSRLCLFTHQRQSVSATSLTFSWPMVVL